MNHYGTLRDYRFAEKDADDIRGSNIYGIDDEKLGDIDDVIFDHSTGDIRYVVVDSGGWLSSKKFLVPADRLRPSTKHDNDYHVDMTKAQIEQFPPYDEKSVEDRDRWKDYDERYEKAMTDGAVMHRKDSPDRIITPPTEQIPAPTRSTNTVITTTDRSRSHLGQRWTNFEDRIRRDRTHIASGCNVCKFTPESTDTVERDRARKIS